MKNSVLVVSALLGLGASYALADKPEWAGEGGQPGAYEKEQHREDMRDKNKKHHDEDDVWDWDKEGGDKDKDKDKDAKKDKKNKNKKK